MTSSEASHNTPGDPLESLLIDAAEVNRAEIANALRDIVAIDSTTGAVVFRPSSRRLTTKQRVLAYLLGRKVSFLLNRIETEAAQPKTIIEETGIATGTVHPKLKELREARIVSQESDGAYWVAAHQVHDALDTIKSEGGSS